MDEIAEKMSTALGDSRRREGDGGDRQTDAEAARLRRRSTNRWCGRKSTASSPTTGSPTRDLPKSTFLADEKWLEESTVSDALGAISGGSASQRLRRPRHRTRPASPSTAPNWSKARRPRSPAKKASKSKSASRTRANRPRTGSPSRSPTKATRSRAKSTNCRAGETGTALIPLTPTPSGEVTLEVEVEAVPGENVTENNEATYTLLDRIAAAAALVDPPMRIAYLGPAGTFTEDALGEALPDGRLRAAADGDDPRRDPRGRARRGRPGAGPDRELARGLGPAHPRHPRLRGRRGDDRRRARLPRCGST